MIEKRGLKALLVAGLALAACGPNIVGSRYVKSTEAVAGQPTLLTVDSTESAELGGTRLDIPIGALEATTRITVELGLSSILGSELSAGPVAVFGPANTTFTRDVTLVLPLTGATGTDDIGIVAEDANGLTYEIDPNLVALNATRTLATFQIRKLGTFQPRRRSVCQSDSQCSMGLQCRNGRCQSPSTADGGPGCAMTCPADTVCDPARGVCTQTTNACMVNSDCAQNLACINGVCTVPNTPACGMNGCASGQVCSNGMCVSAPSDGGSTNPNVCMADSSCAMGQRCVNGVCRSACSPRPESCNMLDDDCDGLVDEGCNTNVDGGVDGGVVCGGIAGVQCPGGEICVYSSMCNPMNGADCTGICQAPLDGGSPNGCVADSDCGMTGVCVNAQCQSTGTDGGSPNACMSSNQCAMGQACVNGTCQSSNPGIDGGSANVCMTSNQCAMGQSCVNGQCQSSNPGTDGGSSNVCLTSNDCAMGQSCIAGRCQ